MRVCGLGFRLGLHKYSSLYGLPLIKGFLFKVPCKGFLSELPKALVSKGYIAKIGFRV